jgi:hypothetical protein
MRIPAEDQDRKVVAKSLTMDNRKAWEAQKTASPKKDRLGCFALTTRINAGKERSKELALEI